MGIRVFLVEDVKHMHGVLGDLLGILGDFKIVAAKSTEAEALLWMHENQGAWDLAVVDLILEQGTGMGVIPRAKKLAPKTPLLVLSDYATPGIRQHCLNLGADAVFQKSHDMHAFMDFCAALADPEPASA